MNGLRPNERLAVNLFYFEEYNISEIVEITGWSKSNTKVILHRARKNLHLGLEESK
jgi:DNA-directed RNA polymerase specialized sigma24 family protein